MMTTRNLHAMAITALSILNVWLFVQIVRWLMYSYPVSTSIPYASLYGRIDPILEIPGIILGIAVSYILLYRLLLNVWKIRYSAFRHELMTRVLSINSVVLLVLTGVGILEWIVWFNQLAIDLITTALFGAVVAIISYFLERRVFASERIAGAGLLPLFSLDSMAAIWTKPGKFNANSLLGR